MNRLTYEILTLQRNLLTVLFWFCIFFGSLLPSLFIRRFMSTKPLQKGQAFAVAGIIFVVELVLFSKIVDADPLTLVAFCAGICNYFILTKE